MYSRNLSYSHFFDRELNMSRSPTDEKHMRSPTVPNSHPLQQTSNQNPTDNRHIRHVNPHKRKSGTNLPPRKQKRQIVAGSYYMCGRERAARRIQHWWYNMRRKQKNYMNDTDFLSLEPFCPRDVVFCLIEESRHVYRFIPVHLAQWFLKEGKFINPYTRTPLNIVELKRLDRMLQQHTDFSVCLAEKYREIERSRRREYEHNETCRMLHNESVTQISSVIQTIIRSTYQSEEHQHGVLEEFNVYCQIINQLAATDNIFALMSLQFSKKLIRTILYDDILLETCRVEQFNMLEFIKINIETMQNQIVQRFMSSEIVNRMLRRLTTRSASAPASAPTSPSSSSSESALDFETEPQIISVELVSYPLSPERPERESETKQDSFIQVNDMVNVSFSDNVEEPSHQLIHGIYESAGIAPVPLPDHPSSGD